MEAEITRELIFEHFSNRITPLQREQIELWLHVEANEELYYQWLEEWENNNPEYLPQSDVLIQKYLDYLHHHPAERMPTAQDMVIESQVSSRRLNPYWASAASILILLGVGLWFFRSEFLHKRFQTNYGEVKSFVLSEGTKVTLNANSILQIPRWGFGQNNREVILQGEAFFAVTHQSNNQKFVVKTLRNFEVVVLGTEFSVFSRQRGGKIVLDKGKVKINYKTAQTKKTLLMKPGDVVAFDKKNQVSRKVLSEPPSFSSWKEKLFIFQETPLTELALLLHETYGLNVSIDSALMQRKLMGSFRAKNVDEFLQAISELLEIRIHQEGKQIRLVEQ